MPSDSARVLQPPNHTHGKTVEAKHAMQEGQHKLPFPVIADSQSRPSASALARYASWLLKLGFMADRDISVVDIGSTFSE